jgi:hypothetical protein
MSRGSIYKIVINGKHYIGLNTTSLKQRKNEHRQCAKNGDKRCLYNAIRKYDMVDTFELIEIDTADTIEELCELEIFYIQEYNSYYMNGNGYNMTLGGEGTNGYVYTEEDKQKMSERMKERFQKPGAREEHCVIMQKRFLVNPGLIKLLSDIKKEFHRRNPEAAKEQSDRLKKYHANNPEAAKEHGKRMKQYYIDHPDAIQSQREMSIKQWKDSNAREQMSKKKKEFYEQNPEQGKLNSERLKAYYLTPGAREKHGESQKKRFKNPDEKQKLFHAQETYWENPDARRAQSKRMKERFQTNPEILKKKLDTQGNNKPFDVFTKDGLFIKTFTYQFEAIKYLQTEHNITSTIKIGEVLRGERNNSAGFVFKYK